MNLTKWLLIAGVILIFAGGVVWLFSKAGIPLGKLPGDIHYKSDKVQIYFPIATSILLSILLSLLFWLFKK
jgi:H+/Cl- antiporter ClcA